MLTLSKLLKYSEIIIQCRDNPDADTLASGYALYEYFRNKGKKIQLVYGGRGKIEKLNLIKMVNLLEIPILYIDNIYTNGLLITVGCQYGGSNVKKFSAANVAIIDHHERKNFNVEMHDIRPYLGSCATLVWDLLKQEKFDFSAVSNAATALFYGLYAATNSLAEISHPLDKDMRDTLPYNHQIIRKLQYSNFTCQDIQFAGLALANYFHDSTKKYAVIKSHSGDLNVLGLISDTILQMDVIDVCVAYNEAGDDIRFSVRTCSNDVMAHELAAFLVENIGFGGGNEGKGSGYINYERLKQQFAHSFIHLNLKQMVESYLNKRIETYYNSFEIINYNAHNLFNDDMKAYKKKKVAVGAVRSFEVFPEGTPLLIRTLEGDVEVVSDRDVYIMIGVRGEVYPIRKQKYEASYQVVDQPFHVQVQYVPTVRNRISMETIELLPYAHTCIATNETLVYAKPVTKRTKVFTKWDYTRYMSGYEGDYIVLRQDDFSDVYIVRQDIFNQTYEEMR